MSRPEPASEKVAMALAEGSDGASRGGELLREESEGSNIPLEVYELMATVINFAQELNEARGAPGASAAGDAVEASAEAADSGAPL